MNKRILISILLIEGYGDYAAMKDFADLVPFTATPAEDEEFHRLAHAHVDEIRAMPTEKLLAIKAAVQSLPEEAKIYNNAVCFVCGEQVADGLAKQINGTYICIPCQMRK